MEEQVNHARVVALSMTHGAALAQLLRAHGQTDHAENVEAALKDLSEIISGQVGEHALEQALKWVSRQVLEEENGHPSA